MIWRKHFTGILSVQINNVNILSEKATHYLLGFPNVASQSFFDNILALWIRILETPSECFLHLVITCFLKQISGSFFENHVYNELRTDTLKFVLKNVQIIMYKTIKELDSLNVKFDLNINLEISNLKLHNRVINFKYKIWFMYLAVMIINLNTSNNLNLLFGKFGIF